MNAAKDEFLKRLFVPNASTVSEAPNGSPGAWHFEALSSPFIALYEHGCVEMGEVVVAGAWVAVAWSVLLRTVVSDRFWVKRGEILV